MNTRLMMLTVGAACTMFLMACARGDHSPSPNTERGKFAALNCGSERLALTFKRRPDRVIVRVNGGKEIILAGQHPASGIWYAGEGFELRGKGAEAIWTGQGQPPLSCKSL